MTLKRWCFFLACVLLILLAYVAAGYPSGKKTYGNVEATVIEVHDGDTLKVSVESWPEIIGSGVGVRVYGVDCRELKTGAVAAKDTVKKWIPEGSKVWLFGLRRDKYFRILASVGYNCKADETEPDEIDCTDLAEELLKHKLAVPYFGEKKTEIPQSVK